MKRFALYLGLAVGLVASCSTQEDDFQTPQQDDVIFYASFEQPTEEGTRVYVNEDLLLRWTADDRVSIFNKTVANQEFKFGGHTGDTNGEFEQVGNTLTGSTIPHIVSVYPYQESTMISSKEELIIYHPAEQTYTENGFGLGANTMVSVSSDNFLQFKNVCGYLMLNLFGEDVSVSSIKLSGNNGECLAGQMMVTMRQNGMPTSTIVSMVENTLTLQCKNPVHLGANAEKSTPFWIVIPPVTFNNGFTITVTDTKGRIFKKSTSNKVTIQRNKLSKMAPTEVVTSYQNNMILYTTSDEKPISPYSLNGFHNQLVSNDYIDGVGILTFEQDVDVIGSWAFYDCDNLISITLPETVLSVGHTAFSGCTNLTNIILPDGVAAIGSWAFGECENLITITLPKGLTSLDYCAFAGCTSLTSLTLPVALSFIGECAFDGCYGLESITVLPSIPPQGGNNMFRDTNNSPIFVPNESLDNYLSAQYWSDYADRLFSQSSVRVRSVSLNKTSIELPIGDKETLFATVLPSDATNQSVTWSSSNTSVATVSSSGVVTAKAIGSATITVKTNDGGKTATCSVSVIDISKYQAGDKAYVGFDNAYPSVDVILEKSDSSYFDVNSTIATQEAKGIYLWAVIPHGYSVERMNNLDFAGDYLLGSAFRKEPIVINNRLYNRFYIQAVLPFNTRYEFFFTKD